MTYERLFSLDGKVAIVTGGTGVLGSAMARGLAAAGAKVGILGRRQEKAQEVTEHISHEGGIAIPLLADVLNEESLRIARDRIIDKWGSIDILVNGAGGNMPNATIGGDLSFFGMKRSDFDEVIALNLTGTVLPCQIFGQVMTEQSYGSIINISSMAATQAITQVVGYSAAKAAVANFTQWLATHFAQTYGEQLRVNAISPGFFIGDQNRRLLLNEDDSLTERGKLITNGTPFGRFGEPDELIGALIWLASDASRFVTGSIIPVDGGFSAFSGI